MRAGSSAYVMRREAGERNGGTLLRERLDPRPLSLSRSEREPAQAPPAAGVRRLPGGRLRHRTRGGPDRDLQHRGDPVPANQMDLASTAVQLCAKADVTGVAFFDFFHHQTSVAPNEIELHPILALKWLG